MTDIKGFLIDLGGVVYQESKPIPGSIEAVVRLREAGIPFRFLTNTTSKPKRHILQQLLAIGVPVKNHDIFTPAIAARAYIIKHDLKPYYLVCPKLREDFRDIAKGSNPAVIVGDASGGFTYRNMNLAFRRVEAGAKLIALANNRKFLDDKGEMCLDVGAFVAALEFGSRRRATVLGKPSPDFFHLAVNSMGLAARETAMIGDDAEFDVSAAGKAGLRGVLVRTGKWKPDAADGLEPPPTAEFEDLRDAVNQLSSLNA